MANWTASKLRAFSERVKAAFLEGKIRAPVHLCGGNEEQLIELFRQVGPQDWVCSGWRSSYHALLCGCPEEWVYGEILAGRSMYLMSREHRLLCSSIVGGILPIAVGLAWAIKREGKQERVWCFVGDMTATTGLFHECKEYARRWDLPLRFVVEDNAVSTDTDTQAVWGPHDAALDPVDWYTYERVYPHVGVGQRVTF